MREVVYTPLLRIGNDIYSAEYMNGWMCGLSVCD